MKAYHENRLYGTAFPFSSMNITNLTFWAHWHNDIEFMFVREGAIRMGINQESRILRKGEMAVCSSGDIHYYDSSDGESKILLLIFNPQLIGTPGGWPKNMRLDSPFLGNPPPSPRTLELVELLDAEFKGKQPQYETVITGMLYELCGLILRHADCMPVDKKKDKRRIANMSLMQSMLQYLESNYSSPITLEDAARQANMSLFHFSRFFKSITGMSFTSYLGNIRVSKSEEMLLNTNKSVTEIALDCGFSNVRTFNRVFRQFTNRTPSSLR